MPSIPRAKDAKKYNIFSDIWYSVCGYRAFRISTSRTTVLYLRVYLAVPTYVDN